MSRFAFRSLTQVQQSGPIGAAREDHLVDAQPAQLGSEMAAACGPHQPGLAVAGLLERRVPMKESAQTGHDPGPAEQAEVHHQRRLGAVGIGNFLVGEKLGGTGDAAECIFDVGALHLLVANRERR